MCMRKKIRCIVLKLNDWIICAITYTIIALLTMTRNLLLQSCFHLHMNELQHQCTFINSIFHFHFPVEFIENEWCTYTYMSNCFLYFSYKFYERYWMFCCCLSFVAGSSNSFFFSIKGHYKIISFFNGNFTTFLLCSYTLKPFLFIFSDITTWDYLHECVNNLSDNNLTNNF